MLAFYYYNNNNHYLIKPREIKSINYMFHGWKVINYLKFGWMSCKFGTTEKKRIKSVKIIYKIWPNKLITHANTSRIVFVLYRFFLSFYSIGLMLSICLLCILSAAHDYWMLYNTTHLVTYIILLKWCIWTVARLVVLIT